MSAVDGSVSSDLEGALTIDETGRATVHVGDVTIHTAFSPLFRRHDTALHVCAVEAHAVFIEAGGRVHGSAPTERVGAIVEKIGPALHRTNLTHRDAAALGFLEHWPLTRGNDLEDLASFVEATDFAEVEPRRLILEFAAETSHSLAPVIAQARADGIAICLRLDAGQLPDNLSGAGTIVPDVARLEPQWMAWIDQMPAALPLLKAGLAGLGQKGVAIFADGIDTAGRLEVAMEAGVDFLHGSFLGAPVIAGHESDWHALNTDALLAGDDKVVMLGR